MSLERNLELDYLLLKKRADQINVFNLRHVVEGQISIYT